MTPGITEDTVDGLSQEKIANLIAALRHERWRGAPGRRTYIAQKHSMKKRPLGIPTWSDNVRQEVIRSSLEAYDEPQGSEHSHGFRPKLGCHTALNTVQKVWSGTKWFIEGDITGGFDPIDHTILMGVLRSKIQDNRFLRRLAGRFAAGYCEEWS